MAQFVIRIHLEGGPAETVWEQLDHAMERSGFVRYIAASGNYYQLPDGEYVGESKLTRSQVLEMVRRAVESAWKQYGLLVTEGQCTFDLPMLKS